MAERLPLPLLIQIIERYLSAVNLTSPTWRNCSHTPTLWHYLYGESHDYPCDSHTPELPHQLLPPIRTRLTDDLSFTAAAVIDPPSASAPPPTSPFPVFLRVTKRRLQSMTDPTVSLHIDLTDSPSFGPSPLGDTLRQARRKACWIRTHTATPSTSSMPPHVAPLNVYLTPLL